MFDKLKDLAASVAGALTMGAKKKKKPKSDRPGSTTGPMSYLSDKRSKENYLDQADNHIPKK